MTDNGSPTNGPTYSTVGPGQWPSPTATPGLFRRAMDWITGTGAEPEAKRPELPRFRSELIRLWRETAPAVVTANPATTPPAGRPTPAKREPGDHTCMIACLIPGSEDRWYILTAGPTSDQGLGPGRYRGLGGTARFVGHQGSDCWMGPKKDAARKFSCPGAAADWFAVRRDAFAGLEGFAIIHAVTGEVVTELTEEVVGGTSGATGPIETPGSQRT